MVLGTLYNLYSFVLTVVLWLRYGLEESVFLTVHFMHVNVVMALGLFVLLQAATDIFQLQHLPPCLLWMLFC